MFLKQAYSSQDEAEQDCAALSGVDRLGEQAVAAVTVRLAVPQPGRSRAAGRCPPSATGSTPVAGARRQSPRVRCSLR